MQYLQRSIKQEVLQLQRNWQRYFTILEKRSHPSRIQGCNNYPPIQTERETSSRHLFIVNCWEDTCKNPTKPTEWTPWTIRASTRKPVWIPEGQRNNRHDLHSKTASREMPGTDCGPLHDLCRPYQSIWHSQSWGTSEYYGKVWLSCQLHDGTMVCLQGSNMMASFLIHSLWQMELSKAVY